MSSDIEPNEESTSLGAADATVKRKLPDGSTAKATKSRPETIKRITDFFDSTTKILVAIGGLLAAATGLWVAVSNLASNGPASPHPTVPPTSVQYVIQPESCGALQYGADGTAGPVLCPDGRPNILADHFYRGYHLRVLELGPDASPTDVVNAICTDFAAGHTTNPIESDAAKLAQTEEQWHFAVTFADGVDSSLCTT